MTQLRAGRKRQAGSTARARGGLRGWSLRAICAVSAAGIVTLLGPAPDALAHGAGGQSAHASARPVARTAAVTHTVQSSSHDGRGQTAHGDSGQNSKQHDNRGSAHAGNQDNGHGNSDNHGNNNSHGNSGNGHGNNNASHAGSATQGAGGSDHASAVHASAVTSQGAAPEAAKATPHKVATAAVTSGQLPPVQVPAVPAVQAPAVPVPPAAPAPAATVPAPASQPTTVARVVPQTVSILPLATLPRRAGLVASGGGRALRAASVTRTAARPLTAAAAPSAPAAPRPAPVLPAARHSFIDPVIAATGPWRGLSVSTATHLGIPIGFALLVGAVALFQGFLGRRDPKLAEAPGRSDADTVPFT